MRVIDKRDKLSQRQLFDELGSGRHDESGARIAGVGLAAPLIENIMEFVATGGATRQSALDALDKLIKPSESKESALAEVSMLLDHLDALGVSPAAVRLDPSLTRGLDYYTGTVFECALPYAGVGSVMGGGRYDGLVSRFQDEPIPATGASIGLDRLVTGLRNVGLGVDPARAGARVMVVMMPGVPETQASRAAAELRGGGIATELYVGEAVGKVGRQLAYANARQLAVAVLLGEEELRSGTVTVKDLREGDEARRDIAGNVEYRQAGSVGQRTVAREELIVTVREMLA
jgi:histidyl-tRNA synthetase